MTKGEKVIGYCRVSTIEQGDSGAGLEAQRQAIESEAERRGAEVVAIYQDVASGKSLRARPGLAEAIAAVRRGDGSALVVSKVDRLSRSVIDFATLLEQAQREKWALVALDAAVDTSTPNGELVVGMISLVSQWERKLIGQRTREGLAVRKAQGVRLGRPPELSPETRAHVRALRDGGLSWAAIASRLNAEHVATAHGGTRWHPSTARAAALALA